MALDWLFPSTLGAEERQRIAKLEAELGRLAQRINEWNAMVSKVGVGHMDLARQGDRLSAQAEDLIRVWNES